LHIEVVMLLLGSTWPVHKSKFIIIKTGSLYTKIPRHRQLSV
jgi:hypothetical protein